MALNKALDKQISSLLQQADKETQWDKKKSMLELALKWEALKLKDKEGRKGSAFRNTPEESEV